MARSKRVLLACTNCSARSRRAAPPEGCPWGRCAHCGGALAPPPKRILSAKGRRDKGVSGELAAVHQLRELWPQARRGAAQSRSGEDCADIEGTPWHVEHKRHRKIQAHSLLVRAETEAAKHPERRRPALLIMRADDDPEPVACLRLSHLMVLCSLFAPESITDLVLLPRRKAREKKEER